MLNHFPAGGIDGGFDDDLVMILLIGLARNRSEVLVASLVANIQNDAPDEIGGEAAQQHYDQHRQPLPQIRGAMLDGERLDGISRGQTVGEAGAHHAREDRHADALLQIEFLDRFLLLFRRHGPLFVDARQPRRRNAQQANKNAQQNDSPGRRPHDLGHEFTAENGRDQRPEGGAEAQHDRHPQRQSEIAHGQAKGEAADPPQQTEEECPENDRARSFVEHRQQVPGHEQGKEPGSDDPAEEAAGQPECFPGPSLYSTIGHIKAAGGQTAQPVIQHANYGIWIHIILGTWTSPVPLRSAHLNAFDSGQSAELFELAGNMPHTYRAVMRGPCTFHSFMKFLAPMENR